MTGFLRHAAAVCQLLHSCGLGKACPFGTISRHRKSLLTRRRHCVCFFVSYVSLFSALSSACQAVRRRFDKRIYIPLPDAKARQHMFKVRLEAP